MDQISNHPLYKKHNIDSAMNSLWYFYKKKFAGLYHYFLVMAIVSHFLRMINIADANTYRSSGDTFKDERFYLANDFDINNKPVFLNNSALLCDL
jgi:hypothetical protein